MVVVCEKIKITKIILKKEIHTSYRIRIFQLLHILFNWNVYIIHAKS